MFFKPKRPALLTRVLIRLPQQPRVAQATATEPATTPAVCPQIPSTRGLPNSDLRLTTGKNQEAWQTN
jgi:hypothetical protein